MAAHPIGSRTCQGCGEELRPTRSNQRYHGRACRVRAHRARKPQATVPECEELVVRLVNAKQLDYIDAIIWMVAPDEARRLYEAREARRAVAA